MSENEKINRKHGGRHLDGGCFRTFGRAPGQLSERHDGSRKICLLARSHNAVFRGRCLECRPEWDEAPDKSLVPPYEMPNENEGRKIIL